MVIHRIAVSKTKSKSKMKSLTDNHFCQGVGDITDIQEIFHFKFLHAYHSSPPPLPRVLKLQSAASPHAECRGDGSLARRRPRRQDAACRSSTKMAVRSSEKRTIFVQVFMSRGQRSAFSLVVACKIFIFTQ